MVEVLDDQIKSFPNRKVGVPLALLAGICWSLAGLVYRLIDSASAWQVLFYRSASLFMMLLVWLLIRYRSVLVSAMKDAGLPALIGGICLSVAFTGYILALDNTSVANAMFALGAAPFFTAVLARVFLREAISGKAWLAMCIAALGLGIMTSGELKGDGGLGNLFAIVAALGFSGMTISIRSQAGNDMLPTILYASFFASVISTFGIISSGSQFILLPIDMVYSMSLGIFQIGLGFLLFTQAAHHLPAVELTLLSLTEIILGPVLVWIAIGELPTSATMIGGILICTAIVIAAILGTQKIPHTTGVKTPFS